MHTQFLYQFSPKLPCLRYFASAGKATALQCIASAIDLDFRSLASDLLYTKQALGSQDADSFGLCWSGARMLPHLEDVEI